MSSCKEFPWVRPLLEKSSKMKKRSNPKVIFLTMVMVWNHILMSMGAMQTYGKVESLTKEEVQMLKKLLLEP